MGARRDRAETFGPLQDKTLHAVLQQRFVGEFGYGDGAALADVIVTEILKTLSAFIRPTEAVQPGQIVWMAVVNDGGKHARVPMGQTPLVPVVLDLVTTEELQALAEGESYQTIRQARFARLLRQALAQGGVLAQSDLAAMCALHRKQVGQAIAAYQAEHHVVLPYRGTVQDLGGTLSHKVEVIRLFEAGYLEPEICKRLAIEHDLTAVENYVQTYKHVMMLLERDFSVAEVTGILGIGRRLVLAYIAILREHHPEIVARHPDLGASEPDSPVEAR